MDVLQEMDQKNSNCFPCLCQRIAEYLISKIAVSRYRKIDKVQLEYFIYLFRLLYGKISILLTASHCKFLFVDQILVSMSFIISTLTYTKILLMLFVNLLKIITSLLSKKLKKLWKIYKTLPEIQKLMNQGKTVKILITLETRIK